MLVSEWQNRCVGAALGALIGDAVGAAFEGMPASQILHDHPQGARHLVPASHMGVYFLPPRTGYYTDDVNSAAAILSSVELHCNVVCAGDIGYRHAKHWHDGFAVPPLRGYPDSAQVMMLATLDQKLSAAQCATLSFKDGSFANGAAMKVFPIAFLFPPHVFASAVDETESARRLREAVEASCAFSHVHPDGVAAAVIQAHAVRLAASSPLTRPSEFIDKLLSFATTARMTDVLQALRTHFERVAATEDNSFATLVALHNLPALGTALCGAQFAAFQIEGPGAVGCALAAALIAGRHVHLAVALGIAFGGDTDTIASMAGAIAGAAAGGIDWCDKQTFDRLENGRRGRDWLLDTAAAVAARSFDKSALPSVFTSDERPYVASAFDRGLNHLATYFRMLPKAEGVKLSFTMTARERGQLPGFNAAVAAAFACMCDGEGTADVQDACKLLCAACAMNPDSRAALKKAAEALCSTAAATRVTKEPFTAAVMQMCAGS